MSAWRAIQTKPNCEPIANRMLGELGIETFYPRRIVRLHRRGSPLIERSCFQGYLFADLDGVPMHSVVNARGVHRVVGMIAIPDPVIVELKARADERGIVSTPLEIGHSYRLLRPGALGDLIAKVETFDTRARAKVLIRLLGMDVRASVATSDLVEPVLP